VGTTFERGEGKMKRGTRTEVELGLNFEVDDWEGAILGRNFDIKTGKTA
jgi:hypothetical protein